ncbi:helix-turn-helix domain-containing protein [Streptomyces sp. GESEQ-4]|uniref:helix-turn-helix domain-containing protein n=1 Tax=Streptomyces sp. GESEQ-4 TaxID=2812655 RepID=UPI001B319F4B|nr:helix-turn-helix domain-containing protein [Streptomyces sp. GESEQ-4]
MSVLRFPALSALPPARTGGPAQYRDSQTWQLALVSEEPLVLGKSSDATRLAPGDLVLWDPSEPFDAAAVEEEEPSRALVLHLPESALPVPHQVLRGLVARPVPSETGAAALLARFVEELAGQKAAIKPPQAAWLGRAVVDLVAAFLTSVTDVRTLGSSLLRQAALLQEITRYIDRHLKDPDLSPAVIAAAHHISVRYLHHLFQQDKRTVCGFIRARRLERCRADLTNPCLAGQSVGLIRVRWGFEDAAVFSRAFKKAYGLAPGEYRKRWTCL